VAVRSRPATLFTLALTAVSALVPLAACGGSGAKSDTPTTIVMMTDQQMDELQEKVRKAVEESPYGSTTVP
jgi:ABC-type glycerol-3-phosphate transport system substrate-binding protein